MMAFKFENKVSMNVFEDYINCTICLHVMKKTVTTSCCHRFCDRCIREWIDRNSKCPCCNTKLTHQNLFNDCQFDSLIENILQDRETAEKKYFEEVCNQRVDIPMKESCEIRGQKEVYNETSSSGGQREGYVLNSSSGGQREGYVLNSSSGGQREGYVLNSSSGGQREGYVLNSSSGGQREGYVLNSSSGGQKEVYVETSSSGQNPVNQPQVKIETVENVLRKHLQKSLADHGRYFQSLQNEYEKKKKRLEREIQDLKDDTHSGMCQADVNSKVEHLKMEIEKLSSDLTNCKQLVAEAYDRYLTDKIPSLSILPVSVSVYIVDKNIRLPDFIFQPEDSMRKLQDLLNRTMLERHDEIIEYTDKPIYIFSPMSKGKSAEEIRNIIDRLENGQEYEGVIRTRWAEKPVLHCEMKPGSEIIILNCMKYDSDIPPICFVKMYEEGGSFMIDYYKCQDCRFSWICKPCIRNCHKDHTTSVHVLSNKPTWACCYCPKKKKCCL